jgi:hypothetical protein
MGEEGLRVALEMVFSADGGLAMPLGWRWLGRVWGDATEAAPGGRSVLGATAATALRPSRAKRADIPVYSMSRPRRDAACWRAMAVVQNGSKPLRSAQA